MTLIIVDPLRKETWVSFQIASHAPLSCTQPLAFITANLGSTGPFKFRFLDHCSNEGSKVKNLIYKSIPALKESHRPKMYRLTSANDTSRIFGKTCEDPGSAERKFCFRRLYKWTFSGPGAWSTYQRRETLFMVWCLRLCFHRVHAKKIGIVDTIFFSGETLQRSRKWWKLTGK